MATISDLRLTTDINDILALDYVPAGVVYETEEAALAQEPVYSEKPSPLARLAGNPWLFADRSDSGHTAQTVHIGGASAFRSRTPGARLRATSPAIDFDGMTNPQQSPFHETAQAKRERIEARKTLDAIIARAKAALEGGDRAQATFLLLLAASGTKRLVASCYLTDRIDATANALVQELNVEWNTWYGRIKTLIDETVQLLTHLSQKTLPGYTRSVSERMLSEWSTIFATYRGLEDRHEPADVASASRQLAALEQSQLPLADYQTLITLLRRLYASAMTGDTRVFQTEFDEISSAIDQSDLKTRQKKATMDALSTARRKVLDLQDAQGAIGNLRTVMKNLEIVQEDNLARRVEALIDRLRTQGRQ